MTWRAISESRLPVGSSASRKRGSPASARAIATRCCWPPESCAGMCFMRDDEADDFERARDALLALARREAAVAQRHVDVVEHVEVGDQVEALEDEADLLVAQRERCVVRQPAHVLAVEPVLPPSNVSSRPGDVQERGLARARRPGDRDELAVAHLEREVAQRVRDEFIGCTCRFCSWRMGSRSLFSRSSRISTRSKSPVSEMTIWSPGSRPSRISISRDADRAGADRPRARRRRPTT